MSPGAGIKTGLLLAWVALYVTPGLHASMLFGEDSPLDLTLTGPVKTLVADKEKRAEMPFILKVDHHEIEIMARSRGKSRMQVCDFPLLRLNFEGTETTGTPFEGQGKLKLVVRCRRGDRSEQDVLEEYAAYRIFALLTDVSYRVRLVRITFDDLDNRPVRGYRQSYGFLIEPLEQLASRVGGTEAEVPAVALSWMDDDQAALVYVFQYLVANTDWSFVAPYEEERCCHNIHLVDIDGVLFPVPYDLDLSGLVNAAYAFPDPSLHIKHVTWRLYRGFCTDTRILRGAIARVASRQEEILNVVGALPFESDRVKADRIHYLQNFFKQAGNGDKMVSKFEKRCLP